MLENVTLVNDYGESFDSAVVEIYAMSPKQVETRISQPVLNLVGGDWVEDASETEPAFEKSVQGGAFKVRYWSRRDLYLQGKKARPLQTESGDDWFAVEFDTEDANRFENGFNVEATESQRLASLFEQKFKDDLLPLIGG